MIEIELDNLERYLRESLDGSVKLKGRKENDASYYHPK